MKNVCYNNNVIKENKLLKIRKVKKMEILNRPKCEKCGQTLTLEERYPMECDEGYATRWCEGVCPECDIGYCWIEAYNVTYRGLIEVIKMG